MKVDPNHAIDFAQEFVLCEDGEVVTHDGARTPVSDIAREGSPFFVFCKSLDPNKCFIVALVPDDADHAVFFQARDAARRWGLHMQSPIDTPVRLREMWQGYVRMKLMDGPEPDDQDPND